MYKRLAVPVFFQRRDGADEYKITHLVTDNEGTPVAGFGPQILGVRHGNATENAHLILSEAELVSVTRRSRR